MTKENKKYIINLLTPYLVSNVSEVMAFGENDRKPSAEFLLKQMNEFGYNPCNLRGTKKLITSKGNSVYLQFPKELPTDNCTNEIMMEFMKKPHLLSIIGCTLDYENVVVANISSGRLFARYSVFYGGKSKYSGYSPEEVGYSFDIPKDVETVKTLLKNDRFLYSLVKRNEKDILGALESINKTLNQPILVTPYLEKALKVEK